METLLLAATICLSPCRQSEEATQESVISGIVRDENGKLAAGIEVSIVWHEGAAKTKSDAAGHFELRVPTNHMRMQNVTAKRDDGRFQAVFKLPYQKPATEPIELNLKEASRVRVRVLDITGKPAPAAQVAAIMNYNVIDRRNTNDAGETVLYVPEGRANQIYAFQPDQGIAFETFISTSRQLKSKPIPKVVTLRFFKASPVTITAKDTSGRPAAGITLELQTGLRPDPAIGGDSLELSLLGIKLKTDAEGVVRLPWVPEWTRWFSLNSQGPKRCADGKFRFNFRDGRDVRIHFPLLVPVSGRVTLPDGSPAVETEIVFKGSGYVAGGHEATAQTDERGRYKVQLATEQLYLALAQHPEFASNIYDELVVEYEKPLTDLDFRLQEPTIVTARVSVGVERKPISDELIQLYQRGAYLGDVGVKLANPNRSTSSVQPFTYNYLKTDANGEVRFRVGRGDFDIHGPGGTIVKEFTVTDQKNVTINFHTLRPKTQTLNGFVTTLKPLKPVANAKVTGQYQSPTGRGPRFEVFTGVTGKFKGERNSHRMLLHAVSEDGTLAGLATVDPDDRSIRIPVRPVAAAKGRLVDGTGEPIPNREIRWGVRVSASGLNDSGHHIDFGGTVKSDAAGHFSVNGLMQGQQYWFSLRMNRTRSKGVATLRPERPGEFDLGDVSDGDRPNAQRWAIDFCRSSHSADVRFKTALTDSRIKRQHVLLAFTDPLSTEASTFYQQSRFDFRKPDYHHLWIPTTGFNANEATELAKSLGIKLENVPLTLAIVRSDGEVLGTHASTVLIAGDASSQSVQEFLDLHRMLRVPFGSVMEAASATAKREGKLILLLQQSNVDRNSLNLARFLEKHRVMLSKDFVPLIVRSSWPGAAAVLSNLRQNPNNGESWLAVLKDGKVVQSLTAERDYYSHAGEFEDMLRKYARNIDDLDIDIIIDDMKNP